ncbi:MAG: type II secretion system F family protein [Candidatus Sumerlaeota bacterium]|nr:type II secretion system F family protein [Candidatus Sumerlaeota bacterium]
MICLKMNPTEKKPSIWERDPFAFLGPHMGCGGCALVWLLAFFVWPPFVLFSLLLLAFPGSRRRAKLILFSELSKTLAHRTPLPIALDLCIRAFRTPSPLRTFPETLFLYPLATRFFLTNYLVARKAWRMKKYVELGMPLSEAMERCGGFNPQEVAIVRAGEEWSLLPEALQRLVKYQTTDQRLASLWKYMLYPFWLAIIAGVISLFILTYILPKFEDMFAQLGATSLPPLTEFLVKFSYALLHELHIFLIAVIILALILYRTGLAWLPIIRRWARADREARWLAALSLALDAGVKPAQAVQSAGEISGGAVEKRACDAAAMIEQGHGVGEACEACSVLSSGMNHQLQLLDGRERYVEGLRAIANDAETDAQSAYQRACAVMEIASHLCVALVIGLLVIAMYLPLFEIGKHVV